MWATLGLSMVLNLAPAQPAGLELKNVRFTQSLLGPERKDSKFLPGELVVLSFDVEGLQATGLARVRYGVGIELGGKGAAKPDFSKAPDEREAITAFGGTRLPVQAVASIGTDTPPGKYVMKVTVTDRVGKGTKVVEREFEVEPARLGFVRVGLSYSPDHPAPPVAVAGQTLFINFGLVGFAVDKKTGQPDMTLELQPTDEKGKPTIDKPFRGTVRRGKEGFEHFIPFDPIAFQTHRTGKFKIVLKVTDNLAGKTAEQSLNVTILDPK